MKLTASVSNEGPMKRTSLDRTRQTPLPLEKPLEHAKRVEQSAQPAFACKPREVAPEIE